MRTRRLLVVSEAEGDAHALLGRLPLERLGFAAPRVVVPAGFAAAVKEPSWDVVLVMLPMQSGDFGALVADAKQHHPEIVTFGVSSSAPKALDEELLAGLEAGVRTVLQPHQTQALATWIERAVRERDARRALKQRDELILAAAGEGIYGLDLEGRTTFINPAAAKMIDWSVGDLLGKPQHTILHHTRADGSPYPREQCPIYAALRDGAVHHVDDEVFWRKDGTSFPVEYVSTPMIEDGQVVGAVVVFRDISRRREMERALAENLRSLEATQAELTTALEQLLSTEELTLTGQRLGAAARELGALVGKLRANATRGEDDTRRDLEAFETMLVSLAYLSSEPAPARAPAIDVGTVVTAAARELGPVDAPRMTVDPDVRAAAAAGDVGELVKLLLACIQGDTEVIVRDDEGVPSVWFRGQQRPMVGADRLSYLLARRLAGRNFGAIETRHEPDARVAFLLRLAPAATMGGDPPYPPAPPVA
jgi:PAS domain S-box-containing protein